jgi:hypothetical protein
LERRNTGQAQLLSDNAHLLSAFSASSNVTLDGPSIDVGAIDCCY